MTTLNTTDNADPFDDLGRPRRRWWILVLVVLAAAIVGGVLYARKHRRVPPPRFLFAHVTRGNVTETIEATGTVQPLVQVQVGSQVSGRIARLNVDFNSRVHQGDLLAEIDPVPFQTVVAQARAAVLSAEATMARARADIDLQERNLARAADLRARGLNAQADLDAARGARDASRAQLQVATAEVARARASLQSAQTNLAYCHITAPIDGLVITRSIDVGQTVAASFQAPVLFVIANDLTQMQVMADIDEADIGKLHQGMNADARVDAFQGETFHGTVRELRFGPTTTQGVVTYPAVISVANPETKLRPGMTATISVITARRTDVLRVPNGALRYRPTPPSTGPRGINASARPAGEDANGRSRENGPANPHDGRLYVNRGGQPVLLHVHVGISDGINTEIEAPEMHAGSEVIVDETDDSSQGGARRRSLF